MIDRLANLGQLCSDFIDMGEDEEVWQRHLETVKKMIGIYAEWEDMWRMLSVEDPNACVALAEELEHKNKTVHYDLDMDDLYERVRE